MKRVLATTALIGLTIGLSACSGSTDSTAAKGKDAGCELESGDAVKSLKVTGKHGEQVKLEGDVKLPDVKKTQSAVLDEGKGDKIKVDKDTVYTLNITMFDGSSGATIGSRPLDTSLANEKSPVAWAFKALGCVTDQGRTAYVIPESELNPSAAESKTPIITVIDVMGQSKALSESEVLEKAAGKEQKLPDGFPQIITDEKTGEPTVKVPEGLPAPQELKIATLIAGDGAEVKDGDEVYVHYTGVIQRTGEVFDSSWKRGQYAQFKTSQVIPGFSKALVGQKVGSRVVAMIPPAEGYGAEGLKSMGHEGDDTMIFVVDILGVSSAQ